MKSHTACPDFSLLSQFLDHELKKGEEAKIKRHLEECSDCHAKADRIGQIEGMVRAELTGSSSQLSPQPRSPECLSPEIVSGYVQRTLPAEEEAQAEKHLQMCDQCLSEVMGAFQVSSLLTATELEPVPATLKARVESLWGRQAEEERTAPFSLLVIQIAKKGLQLLEKHLVPPLLTIEELLAPAPVYRSEKRPPALDLRIDAEQAEIRVTAVQEEEGIALKMTFFGSGQKTLAGQRIFLRRTGRSIFSARTDREGVLRVSRLEPGIYEVICPEIHTTFQLELRS